MQLNFYDINCCDDKIWLGGWLGDSYSIKDNFGWKDIEVFNVSIAFTKNYNIFHASL